MNVHLSLTVHLPDAAAGTAANEPVKVCDLLAVAAADLRTAQLVLGPAANAPARAFAGSSVEHSTEIVVTVEQTRTPPIAAAADAPKSEAQKALDDYVLGGYAGI